MKKIIVVFTIGASLAMLPLQGSALSSDSYLQENPSKTPKNPRVKSSGNLDGSSGKYVSDHKQKKSDFSKPKHHLKKSKGGERKSKSSGGGGTVRENG